MQQCDMHDAVHSCKALSHPGDNKFIVKISPQSSISLDTTLALVCS
jgi:hypothetical protein